MTHLRGDLVEPVPALPRPVVAGVGQVVAEHPQRQVVAADRRGGQALAARHVRDGDVEDFTVSNMSGSQRLAPSTVRGYHLTLRMFCDYLTDARYDWPRQCRDRFDQVPTQVCHEWNTVAHLNDYEGRPGRRPFTYDELQVLFDYLDERVERVAGSGRKGALAALRDAQMIKTAYAFGLRRNELCRLDVADLRPNPHMRDWGTYGSVHVRYGKAIRGGIPRRRTVLAVPEFDWAIAGLRQWVEQARPILNAGDHPALWVSERLSRVSTVHLGKRFAWLRDEAGLDPALSLHCLRHFLSALCACSDSPGKRTYRPSPPPSSLLVAAFQAPSGPSAHALVLTGTKCNTNTTAHGECGQKALLRHAPH